jgi:membrane protease YdiL (CAAX protease family)
LYPGTAIRDPSPDRRPKYGNHHRNTVPHDLDNEGLPGEVLRHSLRVHLVFWWLAALGAREVIPALPGLTVIGTFGPLVAAVILTAQESGRTGLRSLLSRILQWRVAPIWYAVALLGPLVITLAAMVLEVALLGSQPPSLELLIGELPSTLLTILVNAVYMLIFVTLGEEVGWRGTPFPHCRHATAPSSRA